MPNLATVKQIFAHSHIPTAEHADPEADTRAWEQEIDALVYPLYGLTEEEIKIVEGDKSA